MKKTLTFLVILILTAATSSAQQEVEIPTLTSIEVDAEGIPVLHWKMNKPELVDGYIIKRRIVDGQGVISGTYNNVAVIEDNKTFSYADRSNEYGTFAMTSIRQEYYCIAAYYTDDNGKIHYSLMTEPSSTILADGTYDFCEKKYDFHYSKIDDTDHYTIHQLEPQHTNHPAGKDTSSTLSFEDFHKTRRFQIECTSKNGISTFSPIIEIDASKPEAPEKVEITLVTVSDDNLITLTLNASASQYSGNAWLFRRDIAKGIDSTLALPSNKMENETFIDKYADPSRRYSYAIAIDDKCGVRLAESDSAYNIVATAIIDATNTNLISWNAPQNTDKISESKILRKIDNNEWQEVGNVGRLYTDYQDILSNIIADETIYEGRFCYRILVTGTDGEISMSNIACIQREPVIYIPNALNPNSQTTDNQNFRPRADFLRDYHLTIYDKRGAIIFQSDDINEGWNGYDRSSKLCHRDTYVYYMTYKTAAGKQISKSGMVNLLY